MKTEDKSAGKQNTLISGLVGGLSGIGTRAAVHPFDVVKIRFQLQWEGTGRFSHVNSHYRNMSQAFKSIIQSEGLTALWKGHVPGQLLSLSYSTTEFYAYDQLYRMMLQRSEMSHELARFFSGGFAGVAATLVAHPLDTVRTRLVAQGHGGRTHYFGFSDAIRHMYQEKGIRCFYKGLIPTILQIFPSTGIYFFIFYTGKDYFDNFFHPDTLAVLPSNFAIGFGAGMVSKVATHPLDICKKRLQMSGFEYARHGLGHIYFYNGFFQCMKRIYLEENGLIGFYKGSLPNILKSSLSTALHFTFYELGCFLLKYDHEI